MSGPLVESSRHRSSRNSLGTSVGLLRLSVSSSPVPAVGASSVRAVWRLAVALRLRPAAAVGLLLPRLLLSLLLLLTARDEGLSRNELERVGVEVARHDDDEVEVEKSSAGRRTCTSKCREDRHCHAQTGSHALSRRSKSVSQKHAESSRPREQSAAVFREARSEERPEQSEAMGGGAALNEPRKRKGRKVMMN